MDKTTRRRDIILALEQPADWSPCAPPARPWLHIRAWIGYMLLKHSCALLLRHASGVILRVSCTAQFWVLFLAHDRSAIVRLSRSTQDLTPEAFLKDLDLAYGPDPRARVEAVIRSLRHLCLQQGGRGKMHVPCLQAQANFGQVHQDFGMYIEPFMRLPEPHLDALKDLGEIFQPNTEGTALIRSSVLTIELPATLHGVMEALGQVGAPPA